MPTEQLSQHDRRALAKVRLVTVLCCSLLVANDASIYFGVQSDSVQAMFSGLRGMGARNNHLFMPQFNVTTIGDYYFVSSVQIEGLNANTEELQVIHRWLLSRQGKKTLVYNQALRSITRRLCEHGGTVRLKLRSIEGNDVAVENACMDAVFASEDRWIPVRLRPPSIDYKTVRRLWQ
jgi:hypothetical protein